MSVISWSLLIMAAEVRKRINNHGSAGKESVLLDSRSDSMIVPIVLNGRIKDGEDK